MNRVGRQLKTILLFAALLPCGCKPHGQLHNSGPGGESAIASNETDADVIAAKDVWSKLLAAMERGDAASVRRNCTSDTLKRLTESGAAGEPDVKTYERFALTWKQFRTRWRRSEDGKLIECELLVPGEDGDKFAFEKTSDVWKMAHWYRPQ
jgi:hypothetical protein